MVQYRANRPQYNQKVIKKNTKVSLGIKDSKVSRTSSIESKNQTKDLKRRRRLSGLYSNNNSLKIIYV